MESSDLVLSPTPSMERRAWLTQWARDKGAIHPVFNFTSDVAPSDSLWILLAMAVDPESPPHLRASALARTSQQLRLSSRSLQSSRGTVACKWGISSRRTERLLCAVEHTLILRVQLTTPAAQPTLSNWCQRSEWLGMGVSPPTSARSDSGSTSGGHQQHRRCGRSKGT